MKVPTTATRPGKKQHCEFREYGTVPVFLLPVHPDQHCHERGTAIPTADDFEW